MTFSSITVSLFATQASLFSFAVQASGQQFSYRVSNAGATTWIPSINLYAYSDIDCTHPIVTTLSSCSETQTEHFDFNEEDHGCQQAIDGIRDTAFRPACQERLECVADEVWLAFDTDEPALCINAHGLGKSGIPGGTGGGSYWNGGINFEGPDSQTFQIPPNDNLVYAVAGDDSDTGCEGVECFERTGQQGFYMLPNYHGMGTCHNRVNDNFNTVNPYSVEDCANACIDCRENQNCGPIRDGAINFVDCVSFERNSVGACFLMPSQAILDDNDCFWHEQEGLDYHVWKAPSTTPATASTLTSPVIAGAGGDPHIKTWVGEHYDFHGVCDLVLLSNPGFDNGRGMNIHIRNKRTMKWSYISTTAVSIGEDVLQITGGRDSMKYFLNGRVKDADSNDTDGVVDYFAGYKLKYKRISDKAVEYEVVLDNTESILLKNWNGFVSVSVKNPKKEHFDSSVGLMGTFSNGIKLARDNVTIISDLNIFGQEWQVIGSESKLFIESEGPQFPSKCDIPSSIDMRRRLVNSIVTIETATVACTGVTKEDKDLCIFDVIATNDVGLAGAY